MGSDVKLCACGKPARSKGGKKKGRECYQCYKRRRIASGSYPPSAWGKNKGRRALYLKSQCERCGFVPEIIQQLQLDHIDGNRANNHPSNYQTLCANCHALKTHMNGDWRTPSRRPVNGTGHHPRLPLGDDDPGLSLSLLASHTLAHEHSGRRFRGN